MINMEEILIVNSAGVLLLVLSLLSRVENSQEKHFDSYLFDAMIGITLGALVAETLTFVLDGRPGTAVRCLQYLLNAYLFLASCGVGALWVLYVDYRIYHSLKRVKDLAAFVFVPFLVILLLLVCDLFGTGFVFSISDQNVYIRGKLVMLTYLVVFYEYGFSVFLSVRAVKRINHARFFPILYFILPCTAGTLIQGLCYGLSLGWFCVSLAFNFVQMQLGNQNAFVDDLSGLFNRKYYHYVIKKLQGEKKCQLVSGIMMDVNDFKSINDQFGHNMGDDAIRSLGTLISEVITEQDVAFRHAGDEFIIVSMVKDASDAEQLMDALSEKIEKFNAASGKPYRLSLAMGYTVCNSSELDSDRFLHQMDLDMYEKKSRYYLGGGKDRRRRTADRVSRQDWHA